LMAAVKGILGGEACAALPCPGTASVQAPATTSTPVRVAPVVPGFLELPIFAPLDAGTSTAESGLFGFLSKVLAG
ncbi:MAG: hypothetical protein ACRDZU_09760, partial [Acidimicrobiales bacterium]